MLNLPAQHLEVLVGEALGLPAAVRARAKVARLTVLAQHLLNEGLAHAERGGDFFDSRVAALDRRDHLLPKVYRVGAHGCQLTLARWSHSTELRCST